MTYSQYINLGFTRHEMNDQIEFNQTGYTGYSLSAEIDNKLSVCVSSGELDRPKLYIKKPDGDSYHILLITPEMVRDLFRQPEPDYTHFA